MTNRPNHDERDPLAGHREELAAEFVRIARAEPPSQIRSFLRLRRKLVIPLAALTLAGGTAGVATAVSSNLLSSDGHELSPASSEAPFSPECPAEVRQSIWDLDQLSDYTDSPGYPVEGCPSLEELEKNTSFLALFERRDEPGAIGNR